MNEILVKVANDDVLTELKEIGFDNIYLNTAQNKYKGRAYKIFNVKPYEANILKQICLSLGFDCAVSRDTVTCKCDLTDCLIYATKVQYEKLIQKLKTQPFRLNEISEKLNAAVFTLLTPIKIRDFVFNWERPYIMGILNVTPDSFSDGGKYNSVDRAYSHCLKMIEDGANIIDIGGESTRPEAQEISTEEEIKRVLPVIEKIRKNDISIPLSVDTRNFETAKQAIEAGADIINDVSGLDYDSKLFDYVTKKNIPTIIMHSDKVPAVSDNYTQGDIVEEIYKSLNNKIEKLLNAGMKRENIIADVGIGFGKNAESNFQLLKRIEEFTGLKTPLLLGISRKSFIRDTFKINVEEADIPTALYSVMSKSINIHRVHNVKMTKEFLNFAKKIC